MEKIKDAILTVGLLVGSLFAALALVIVGFVWVAFLVVAAIVIRWLPVLLAFILAVLVAKHVGAL